MPASRRPSVRGRRGSVVSVESGYNEDTNEMFSGAASEVIPSSISSLHHPHHFAHRDSREVLPLLEDLRPARSNSTTRLDSHFKFFSTDEIETAVGGSTLEDPLQPVDYNTDWEYSLDKYEEEANLLIHPTYDAVSDSESINTHEEFRRRGSDSELSKLDSELHITQKSETYANATTTSQRFYLAEEDLVIGIAGYKNSWKYVLYWAVCIGTLGLGYLVLRWFPRWRVWLQGDPCVLARADWVVVETQFGELAFVNVDKTKYGERLSGFCVPPDDHNPTVAVIHSFRYRYVSFFYSPAEDMFKTNSTWYDPHWQAVKHIKNGLPQLLADQRTEVFGANSIEIDEKPLGQLLLDEVLHPFYVFQIFSVFLWLADDYVYYALCILVISVVSVANTLIETRSTMRRLQQMSRFNCDVRVWRNEFWKQLDLAELVPGDVIEIDQQMTTVPCDALLLNGECVVNESMLTGESVPVSKFEATNETVSHLRDHFTSPLLAKSFLYNGTRLLKAKSSNEEPVVAMVVKTGFNTTKGSLVRSMLFPKPTGFKFYRDSFRYIGFMTGVAALGFIYSTYNFIRLGLPRRLMVLRALDIITIVVPPALPATLTIGTTFAISRLKKCLIFCIAPTRVNVGGKLDVVCFDKTGTLTEDGLDVLGLHATAPIPGRKAVQFGDRIDHGGDSMLTASMACCHSLRLIDGELLGDPLDLKMFEASRWKYDEAGPTVSSPHGQYVIAKEYEFVSQLRRMSVIARSTTSSFVFTKGAPEVMVDICDPATIPQDFEELLHHYTHGGYRVIACAYKPVKSVGDRELVERDLTFCGFIVFENKLKPATSPTLAELAAARIRTIMCTGDNVLTAISVGRECGLVPKAARVYVPSFDDSRPGGLVWEDVDDSNRRLDGDLHPVSEDIRADVAEYCLAVTGEVFRFLVREPRTLVLEAMLMKGAVFARMSPDEKHELVEQLQRLDYTVGFCGDGANDCGALKAADVGVSLSEAEASVAAPFTSRVFEIGCVLDVIKEGRSSLVTSFSCFKYMSLYSAIQFVTVLILYSRGTNLGDFQFLYIDMFLILPLAVFMAWSKPYPRIVVKRPTANLVLPKVLVPLIGQIALLLAFQVLAWRYVQTKPWYQPPVPGNDEEVQLADNTMLFLFSNFQYVLIALITSQGAPYRQPIWENKPFVANVAAALLLSVLLFSVDENLWWGNLMQLTNLSRSCNVVLVVLAALNLAAMHYGEVTVFPAVARWYKRASGRITSKKKFKRLLGNHFEVA